MRIFAIGDLHLSFDNRIEKPMDIFGRNWTNHADRVKESWEEVVGPEDYAIIPGDISWGLRFEEALADLEWIHNLPGKKILTKGNHDLWWASVGKLNKLYDDMIFLQNNSHMITDEIAVCGSRLWVSPGTDGFGEHDEKIYARELMRLEMSLEHAVNSGAKHIITALHFPPTNDTKQPSRATALLEKYGVKTCIYGHLHGSEAFKNGIDGVLNGIEYRLVSLDYLECMPRLIYKTEG